MNLKPSPVVLEKRLCLEQQIRDRIRKQEITSEQLAEKLGLLPTGGKVLLAQDWSLDTAVRVAEAIGFSVRIQVETESE